MNGESTRKRYFLGTHRAVPPDETLARVGPIASRFGVTRVGTITGLDRIGVPVALAFRPASRSVAVSAGKGLDLAAAKASALMEAIECAHAEAIDRPLLFGSRLELSAGRQLVDASAFPRRAEADLSEHTRLFWIEAVDLVGGGPVWVPYELVHAHYAEPYLPEAPWFLASTNGLASGNTFLEAVVHGLCEVIERDAFAALAQSGAGTRDENRLDLATVDDPSALALLDRLGRAGFQVSLWRMPAAIDIAAFHCILIDTIDGAGHPGSGSGCHPDRNVALLRAVLEAIQVRAIYISGARDDLNRGEYERAHMDRFRRASAGASAGALPFDAVPSSTNETAEDAALIVRRLARAGFESACIVDLSRPGEPIHVARSLVPGLRGPEFHG